MSLFLDVQLFASEGLANLDREIQEKFRREVRTRLKKAADVLIRAEREHSISERVERAISAGISVNSPDDFQVTIGPETKKAFFAGFLEKGTKASAARPFSTRAFPFREPSLEATEEAIFELIGLNFIPRPNEIRGSLRRLL
jgi:HK97 gp10 family phage protein